MQARHRDLSSLIELACNETPPLPYGSSSRVQTALNNTTGNST
jgi:hypothetical protein